MATVLLVQREFAHYRSELLRALSQSAANQWVFAHDDCLRRAGGADRIRRIDPSAAPFLHTPVRQLGPFAWQSSLARLISELQPDVVILPGDWRLLSNLLVMIRRRVVGRNGGKVLLWTHGWTRQDGPVRKMIKRCFFGMADGVLVYSVRGGELGTREGFSIDQIHVVGNSTLSERSLPALAEQHRRARLDRVHGHPLELICVARLTLDRELDEVLEAQAILGRQGVPNRLTLVGEGAARVRLEKIAIALGVQVRFLGPIYDDDALARTYAECDICVVSGRAGLTVIQALAHGLPVIAHGDLDSQMPEVEAISQGASGYLYQRGNPDSLAKAVLRVRKGLARGSITEFSCQQSLQTRFTAELQAANFEAAVAAVLRDHKKAGGRCRNK